MGYFEIFLVLSSLISLSVGVRLFYVNYKLTEYAIDALNKQIELTEELVISYNKIQKLEKK